MKLINKILKEDIFHIIFKNWQWNVKHPHVQAANQAVLIKKRWYSIKQHILWKVYSDAWLMESSCLTRWAPRNMQSKNKGWQS
jgi:hypothetical protein